MSIVCALVKPKSEIKIDFMILLFLKIFKDLIKPSHKQYKSPVFENDIEIGLLKPFSFMLKINFY